MKRGKLGVSRCLGAMMPQSPLFIRKRYSPKGKVCPVPVLKAAKTAVSVSQSSKRWNRNQDEENDGDFIPR